MWPLYAARLLQGPSVGIHMEVCGGEHRRSEDVSRQHARMLPAWHATDTVHMPRLDGALQEVAYAPAATAASDQSGVCGVVACPALRGPARVGWARQAWGLRTDDALPLAGRVACII